MATKAQLETENAELRAQLADSNKANEILADENQFLLNKIKVEGKKTMLTKLRLKLGL